MDIDNIISKYLKGEISLDEQHKLTKWLNDSEANQHVFNAINKYYKSFSNNYTVEKEQIEKKIFDQIYQAKSNINDSRSLRLRKLTVVAATIIMVLCSILFIEKYESVVEGPSTGLKQNAYIEKATLPGQKMTTKLPDGTMVYLNSGSRLIVPEKFNPTVREVEFHGEAFFDVRLDTERPFMIKTGGFVVKVLGTSFNVKAYPNMPGHSVAVKTGMVRVRSDSNKSVELNPDQMVNIQKDGSISKISKVDSMLVYGWMNRFLVFQDDALPEVFENISLWFGVDFEYDENAVPQHLFTASFGNPTLKEIMINISKVYGFSYVIENNKVLIKIKE